MTQYIPPENSLSTEQSGKPELALPPPSIQTVTTWKVACDGDDAGGMGHPRVWLAISPEVGFVDCGYCDKRYVIDRDHAAGDH